MLYVVLEIVFWSAAGLLAYTYLGYPLLLAVKARLGARPVSVGDSEPTVTVLITAYNEEGAIRQKIENTLALLYPPKKLEVIVASDASSDGTDRIVKEFAHRSVRLVRQDARAGKTAAQNLAVSYATGEIILFSDATTHYPPDVLLKLVPYFADPSVGCVAGRLEYVDDLDTPVGRGTRRYWKYETFLKSMESSACSLIGASGCLYAVRREAYTPMYAEACSDFLICTSLYRKGFRSVFAPDAVCYEKTNRHSGQEMNMRVRVIAQTFTDLWRNRDMMNPLRSGFFAVQLVSHKLFRYLVPFLLVTCYAASVVLAATSSFYVLAALGQTAFYLAAIGGWWLERHGRRSVLATPQYFMLANVASLIGVYRFLRGDRFAAWEPIRETADPK
jgi:cellulose synthase/poly-beta-1,6-N-acetylglucosamine synthase-like glycosyltransferase